jgi:hypothetical protein
MKPTILSDADIQALIEGDIYLKYATDMSFIDDYPKGTKVLLEAQLDADVAYYEPLIQQAKAEVAREIFEAVENGESSPTCPCGCWQELKSKYGGQKK